MEMMNKAFGQLMEAGDSPAFFKILRRGDLSTEIKRMVPNHFLRSIPKESFSFRMVLKVLWGSWVVKLSKNPTFYYMEEHGWNKFVEDNGLGDDESLTFTHEGNMRFKVTIFEADGEEMLEPRRPEAIPSSSSQNKREGKRIINTDVKEEQEIESLSKSSYSDLKTADCASGRLKQKQKLSLGIKKAEEAAKSKRKKIINIDVKEEQELDSLSESSNSGLKTAECASKQKQKLSLRKKKAEEAGNSKKKNRNVEAAYNDSEDTSLALGPKFTITITKSYLCYLGVPMKFANMYMPKETTTLKIHNEEGSKSWDILYRRLGIEARFNAGWNGLVRDLGLEKGDVCGFTLIKPTEMLVKVLCKATP